MESVRQSCNGDEVAVPSSSVIIDGPHFDEMPIDQPLRGKTDEDVLPFTRDKYGKRIPESLHSPNGKFAEERRFNPDRPAGSKLLLVLRSILNSKTPPQNTLLCFGLNRQSRLLVKPFHGLLFHFDNGRNDTLQIWWEICDLLSIHSNHLHFCYVHTQRPQSDLT